MFKIFGEYCLVGLGFVLFVVCFAITITEWIASYDEMKLYEKEIQYAVDET